MVEFNLGELDESQAVKKKRERSSEVQKQLKLMPEEQFELLKPFIVKYLSEELPFPALLWSDTKQYIIDHKDEPELKSIAQQIIQKNSEKPYRIIHDLINSLLREQFNSMRKKL